MASAPATPRAWTRTGSNQACGLLHCSTSVPAAPAAGTEQNGAWQVMGFLTSPLAGSRQKLVQSTGAAGASYRRQLSSYRCTGSASARKLIISSAHYERMDKVRTAPFRASGAAMKGSSAYAVRTAIMTQADLPLQRIPRPPPVLFASGARSRARRTSCGKQCSRRPLDGLHSGQVQREAVCLLRPRRARALQEGSATTKRVGAQSYRCPMCRCTSVRRTSVYVVVITLCCHPALTCRATAGRFSG